MSSIEFMKDDELAEHIAEMPKDELVMLLTAATPLVIENRKEKLSWKSLPFIPQDLGFEEKELQDDEKRTIRVYHKGPYACVRVEKGWNVTYNGIVMNFEIKSKFHAFQLFKMLGMNLRGDESSVIGLDTKLQDIINS